MSRKRAKKRAQGTELTTLRAIAEAALLVAIFTVLAVQMLRLEKFETEKNAMLLIIAITIIGTNVVEAIYTRGRFPDLQLRHNWLFMAMFALLGVMMVSSFFSANPSYSFVGEPTRSQGVFTYIIYMALLWQSARSSERLKKALIPLMIPPAFVMCLWALFQNQVQDRPGSTTGQPNFLSMWLVFFLIYLANEMLRAKQNRRLLAYYSVLAIVAVFTIVFILSSRGALLGFAVSILLAVAVVASALKQRLLIMGGVAAFGLATITYVGVSWGVQADAVELHEMGTSRLLVPNDQSRIELWSAGISVIEKQGQSLPMPEGVSDDWVFLRRLLGYGLNTIEYTQSRFGAIVGQDLYIDRFHNLFLDALVETGILGLIAWLAVYETAFFMLLKRLGFFIRNKSAFWWLGVQIACVPIGVGLAYLLMQHDDFMVLLPFGGGLAMLGGTILWIIKDAFKPAENGQQLQGKGHVIAVLCMVSAQLMIAQLNVVPIAGQTLFWIMIGLALSSHDETTSIEPVYWYVGVLLAGLFILFSLGQNIDNSFIQSPQDVSKVPILLASILVVGGLGVALTEETFAFKNLVWKIAMIVVAWGIFFTFREAIILMAGQNLEQTLTGSTLPTIGDFRQPFTLVAVVGVALVFTGMSVFLWLDRSKLAITPSSVGLVIFVLLVASWWYINDYTNSALYQTANGFRDTDQPQAVVAADLIYGGLLASSDSDPMLRVDRISAIMKQVVFTELSQHDVVFAQMEREHKSVLDSTPFFLNSRRWAVFDESYQAFLGQYGR